MDSVGILVLLLVTSLYLIGYGSSARDSCIKEVNGIRARLGKPALTHNSKIEEAAKTHNELMVRDNCVSSKCPKGSNSGTLLTAQGYKWSKFAELTAGGSKNCFEIIQIWENDKSTVELIKGKFVHLGCSRLLCEENTCEFDAYYTCIVATPSS